MSRATSSLQVTGISYIKASPYVSKAQMMQMFNISQSTASRRISDLDRYVQNGRYGPYTILDGAGVTWVNYLALVDYLRYKLSLEHRKVKFRHHEIVQHLYVIVIRDPMIPLLLLS